MLFVTNRALNPKRIQLTALDGRPRRVEGAKSLLPYHVATATMMMFDLVQHFDERHALLQIIRALSSS